MRPAAAPAANKSSPAAGVAPRGCPREGVSHRPPSSPRFLPGPPPPQGWHDAASSSGEPRHKAGRSRRPPPRTDLEPPRAPLRFWSPPSRRCSPAGRGEAPPTCSSPPPRRGKRRRSRCPEQEEEEEREEEEEEEEEPHQGPARSAPPSMLPGAAPPAFPARPPLPPSPPGRAGRRRGKGSAAPAACGGGTALPAGPAPLRGAAGRWGSLRRAPEPGRAYLPPGFVPAVPAAPLRPLGSRKMASARRGGGRGGRGARWLAGACSPVAGPKRCGK